MDRNQTSKASSGGGCCGGSSKQEIQSSNEYGLRISQVTVDPTLNRDTTTTRNTRSTRMTRGTGTFGSPPGTIEAKVILLGDSGVGKSSIATRYCKDEFNEQHDVTIGGAYMQQTVTLPDGTAVKMHIWDTGGSDRFRAMVSLYYRDAAAAIICYDVKDEKSFESVHYWVNEMQQNSNTEEFTMALCGNKCDIDENEKKISKQQAQDLSSKNQMINANTSAKTGQGIKELFGQVAQRIIDSKRRAQADNTYDDGPKFDQPSWTNKGKKK